MNVDVTWVGSVWFIIKYSVSISGGFIGADGGDRLTYGLNILKKIIHY